MRGNVIAELFLIYAAAKVLGAAFERLGQPAVVGELLAGVLIGPHVLAWIHLGEVSEAFAQVGVVVLLFTVGLGTHLEVFRAMWGRATAVSLGGMALSFAGGWGVMRLLGRPGPEALFVGAALVATSAGVTARAFQGLGVARRPEARLVVSAAVIDDVLGLAILAVVVGRTAGVSAASVGLTLGEAAAFIAVVLVAGPRLLRRHAGRLTRARLPRAPLAVALVVCLGLSALAQAIGLAALVGAFLAGMVFAETRDEHALEASMAPIADLLVPFFFVVTGARLDPGVFSGASTVWLTLAITGVAVAAKVVGCGLPALGMGRRRALAVGVGMVPRGEVGIVVASVGLSLAAVAPGTYGAVIGTAMLTTLLVPPFLGPLFAPPREGVDGPPERPV